MKIDGWEQSETTRPLRRQIEEYVKIIVDGVIPGIPIESYRAFRDKGSRAESEQAYFAVRKQLTALGCYLQCANPTQQELSYFNELLWRVANEFTWCLAAHLSYGEECFSGEPEQEIDLFAAETAATLSELITLHQDLIDPYIRSFIRTQVNARVFLPFLRRSWNWETSRSNWCAVCSGAVGMAALWLERGERKVRILERVDRAMTNYLNSFGEDGATEEGVGYWAYGFGYFIYYTSMRKEQDTQYLMSEEMIEKVKKIAEFPSFLQISEEAFVPFSDVSEGTLLPSGLLSYMRSEYGIKQPQFSTITSFDFDHCYRYAHISRNLWWTQMPDTEDRRREFTHYFSDRQWLVQKKNAFFLAVKGGSNKEEHNHNDIGSFVLAIGGELFLTDLGAGPYTSDYFGSKRYEQVHTRSYWHNVPLIEGKEQIATPDRCEIQEVYIDGAKAEIGMELVNLYGQKELQSFRRHLASDLSKRRLIVTDEFAASKSLDIEEAFVSKIKPVLDEAGTIAWISQVGRLELKYDAAMCATVQTVTVMNHQNEPYLVYRVGIRLQTEEKEHRISLEFRMNLID